MLQASSHCLRPCQQRKGLGRRWAFSPAVHALKFNVKKLGGPGDILIQPCPQAPQSFLACVEKIGQPEWGQG